MFFRLCCQLSPQFSAESVYTYLALGDTIWAVHVFFDKFFCRNISVEFQLIGCRL